MKASLVSATSVFALLALDGGPALANVAFTVTNLSFGDVLVGVVSSPGTSTATDTGTTAINLTWPAASSPFAPTTTATATLAATGASATRSYTVTPTGTGTATQNLVVKGSQGLVNASQALTLTVTGVAPIESIATQATTYALVKGPSAATTVTVSNIGNGSLATNGTAAQKTLLGSTGSVSGSSFFSGSGGSFTGSSGLKDSNAGATTATFTYDYAPTIRGVNTATVVSTFTNGKSNGTNCRLDGHQHDHRAGRGAGGQRLHRWQRRIRFGQQQLQDGRRHDQQRQRRWQSFRPGQHQQLEWHAEHQQRPFRREPDHPAASASRTAKPPRRPICSRRRRLAPARLR